MSPKREQPELIPFLLVQDCRVSVQDQKTDPRAKKFINSVRKKVQISYSDADRLVQVAELLSFKDTTQSPFELPELHSALELLFEVDFIGVAVWDQNLLQFRHHLCKGRDASIRVAYESRFQFIDPFRHGKILRPNRGYSLSRMIDRDDLVRTAYYTDHLQHYDLYDGVEVALHSNGTYVGDLRLWRGASEKLMDERQEKLLDLLSPLVAKALEWNLVSHDGLVMKQVFKPKLTPREIEILALVAAGNSDKKIARYLNISYWTVRTHIGALLQKTKTANRTELAGLVDLYLA